MDCLKFVNRQTAKDGFTTLHFLVSIGNICWQNHQLDLIIISPSLLALATLGGATIDIESLYIDCLKFVNRQTAKDGFITLHFHVSIGNICWQKHQRYHIWISPSLLALATLVGTTIDMESLYIDCLKFVNRQTARDDFIFFIKACVHWQHLLAKTSVIFHLDIPQTSKKY